MIQAANEAAVAAHSRADEPISEVVPIRREPAPIALEALWSEGLGTLVSALGAALIACQLTQGLQFVNAQRRDEMLPFNLSDPTNTLFQYAIGVAIALGVLLAYGRFVAQRLGPVARNLDLLAATALLLAAGLAPGPRLLVAALVVRLAAGARLVLRADRASPPSASWVRLAAWAPLTSLLVCLAGLLLVVPSGVSAAVRAAPAWLLLAAAAPAALFLFEETLSSNALRWERRIGLGLGLVAIPLLTFRVSAAYFDFATIVGPVNDLMHGKDITAGVVSTYGFLFTYAVAGVFSLLHVSDPFIGTAVLNAVAFSAGYAAVLLFLAHRIQRISLCLATLGMLLAFNFFHLHVPMSWLPQSGFLRFGGVLPVFLLLYAWSARPESRRVEWAFAACTALAVFWTIEVGLYITLGLAAAWAHQLWFRAPGDRRPPLRLLAKTAASVALLAACFTLRIGLRHGHLPVWAELLHFQRAYSAGLAMSPPTTIERWPVPILVYLATLFVAVRAGRSLRHAAAWVFLAAFGLASMVYPLGKGGIWDLGRVALPAILLSAVCVDFLFRERTPSGAPHEQHLEVSSLAPFAWFAAYACAACLVYSEVSPPLALAARLENSHQKPIAHEAPSWQTFLRSTEARTLFESDLAAIRELVPPDAALPIISRNDTLYYVFAGRKAVFKNSFYPHFFFKSDIDEMVHQLEAVNLAYLFVDRSSFQVYENQIDVTIGQQVKERLRNKYRLVKHAGLLDVYQRI
jgi:hypothetical protein